jgi:hypothetical protein
LLVFISFSKDHHKEKFNLSKKRRDEMNKKLGFLIFILAIAIGLCLTAYALADVKGAQGSRPITVEGSIQGLQSACMGVYCKAGEEGIVAAMEDEFVLATEDGVFYSLPNLKPTLLARYLARPVRVTGNEVLGGKAILVQTAEVMEKGKWSAFWSPDIADKVKYRRGTP